MTYFSERDLWIFPWDPPIIRRKNHSASLNGDAPELKPVLKSFEKLTSIPSENLEIEVRHSGCGPGWTKEELICNWHHEGPDPNIYIVMWSDLNPTELLRVSDNCILQPMVCNLMMFRNGAFMHRMPKMSFKEAMARSFIRIYLRDQTSLREVNVWPFLTELKVHGMRFEVLT